MAAGWIAASTAVNVGMSIIGGNKQAAAAAEQARAQNRAMFARYQYDLNMWDAKKSQLQAERMEAIDRIMADARNQGNIKAYKDAANNQQYEYALQIRNNEQAGAEAAYQRSEDIYTTTTDLNSMSAKAAMDSEIIKLQESEDQAKWDRNESRIEMLQNEGKLRARGASGRTADKATQATMADYGRQMEMLNASSDSFGRNTRGVLEEIIRDKSSADLSAHAARMLKPGESPMPIKAAPIPEVQFTLPRALQDYDFGPLPVKGAMASPGAAASMVWGQTLTNIGGAIGSGVNAYAGTL